MTKEEILKAINAACPWCAQGRPATPHLGGAEYIHSHVAGTSHSVTMCQATALRVKYKDVLENV